MRQPIGDKLHISTIDADCAEYAREYGLGLEIAEFCWAHYLDCGRDKHMANARRMMQGLKSFWLHAPFAEISPCALDPRVRELTRTRYLQAFEAATELGINRLVVHGGYIPHVYFPEWYVDSSAEFWRSLLNELPRDITIALENVMEPAPDMLVEIADAVDDPRLGLCLDLGHANCDISSTPPVDWIAPMAKRLKHVHLHNNMGGNDLHNCLGDGTVPMEKAIDLVTILAPNATFTIENQRCQGTLEWLEKHGFLR